MSEELSEAEVQIAEIEDDLELRRPTDLRSWLQDLLESLLLVTFLVIILNALMGRYVVQEKSMEPALYEGQFLLASKIAYWLHPPERGDIVVFSPPSGEDVLHIKRIIGLPGERIEVHNQRVWINGIAINELYVASPPSYQGAWALGENEYFVLGDNRNFSSDSHNWGSLPGDRIVGKIVFCYWPPERWGKIPHYRYPELEETK